MANKYCELISTNKIKDEYTKINQGFKDVETDTTKNADNYSGHIDGTDDRHSTSAINNDSQAIGTTQKDVNNNFKNLFENINAGDSNAAIGVYDVTDDTNTNDYVGTISGLTMFQGFKCYLTVSNINTGPCTLTINGISYDIKKLDSNGLKQPLSAGELYGINQIQYDGTDMVYFFKNAVLSKLTWGDLKGL